MAIENFVKTYTERLIELLQVIDIQAIGKIVQVLERTIINNSVVYIIGNGGSAATASHMVNDLGIGLKRRGIKNFNVMSLADNTPVTSAIANDIGYEYIFSIQLQDKLKRDDVLIAISCSGNSPNIINAVEYAHKIGADVIGVSGFDGGRLKELSNVVFHIDTQAGEYGLVEDMHMILDHIIYSYYIETVK